MGIKLIRNDRVREIRKLLSRATDGALRAVGHKIMLSARANARQTDHSMADLAAMDHPYADRHGRLTLDHGGTTLADGKHAIHKRSGDLARSIKGRYVRPDKTFTVFFDLSRAPHAKFVIEGTKIMLPRDLLVQTAIGLSPELNKIVRDHFAEALGGGKVTA